MPESKYYFIPVTIRLNKDIKKLLEENGLPTEDIDDHVKLLALVGEDGIIGTGGLEYCEDNALMRSICVKPAYRGLGFGRVITMQLESLVMEKNIGNIFLLTTTAKDYFQKLGYELVERNDVPLAIKNTSEFSVTCPSSATVMMKSLL